MTSSQPKRVAESIMNATDSTLRLYALIVVIVEVILGAAVLRLSGIAQIVTIAGMILILVLVIVISGMQWTKPTEGTPSEIISLWKKEDIPIEEERAKSFKGRWNCRWTYYKPSGELAPYTYDRIDIQELDAETGELKGSGLSESGPGTDYDVYGRVSKRGFMYLIYSTPGLKSGLAGIAILRLTPMGKLQGWWFGGGREGGTVGGQATWIRETEDPDFKPEFFPIETDN